MASHNEAGTFDAVDDALAMFHQMDSDQNGSLDLSEMQYMLADFGLSEVDIENLLIQLDVNRDGSVDQSEWVRGYRSLPWTLGANGRPEWLQSQGPGQLTVKPHRWGLTVGQFKKLMGAMRLTDRYRELKKEGIVNMYAINAEFNIPWTANHGCSVTLLMNGATDGLASEVMISHAWAEDNEQLQDAIQLLQKQRKLADTVVVWICTLSQYQPKKNDQVADIGPTIQQQLDLDPFTLVIESHGLIYGLVAVHTTTCDLYTRLWCPFELHQSMVRGIEIEVAVSSAYLHQLENNYQQILVRWDQDQQAALQAFMVQNIVVDTASARCGWKADQDRITAEIVSQGGFDRLDTTIFSKRKQLLQLCMSRSENKLLQSLSKQLATISNKLDLSASSKRTSDAVQVSRQFHLVIALESYVEWRQTIATHFRAQAQPSSVCVCDTAQMCSIVNFNQVQCLVHVSKGVNLLDQKPFPWAQPASVVIQNKMGQYQETNEVGSSLVTRSAQKNASAELGEASISIHESAVPQMVVVCMSYGAERAAKDAILAGAVVSIWFSVELFDETILDQILLPFLNDAIESRFTADQIQPVIEQLMSGKSAAGCGWGVELGRQTTSNLTDELFTSVESVHQVLDHSSGRQHVTENISNDLKLKQLQYEMLASDGGLMNQAKRMLDEGLNQNIFISPPPKTDLEVGSADNRSRAVGGYLCNHFSSQPGTFDVIYRVSDLEDLVSIVSKLEAANRMLLWVDVLDSRFFTAVTAFLDKSLEVTLTEKLQILVTCMPDMANSINRYTRMSMKFEILRCKQDLIGLEFSETCVDLKVRGIGTNAIAGVQGAFEDALGSTVEAIFADDNGELVVLVQTPDIMTLHQIRDQVLPSGSTTWSPFQVEICHTLQLIDPVVCDVSHFADGYTRTSLVLDKPTVNQWQVLLQIFASARATHLRALAGAGKTFILTFVLLQVLKDSDAVVLVVTNTQALMFHVTKWIWHRTKKSARATLLQRIHYLSSPFESGLKQVTLDAATGTLKTEPVPHANRAGFRYTVIDEAHHCTQNQEDLDCVLSYAGADSSLLACSDLSQAYGGVAHLPEMLEVQLTQVVRSTERIVMGSLSFGLEEDKQAVDCASASGGPPVKTFIFSAVSQDDANFYPQYAAEVKKALNNIEQNFPKLNLNDHVLIVVPDEDFSEHLLGPLRALLGSGFILMNAADAASQLSQTQEKGVVTQRLVLDTVKACDGLERLFCICVGLDCSSSSASQVRSSLYRGMTRAQLQTMIVNNFVEDGFLAFLGFLHTADTNDDKFSLEKTQALLDDSALDKIMLQDQEEAAQDKSIMMSQVPREDAQEIQSVADAAPAEAEDDDLPEVDVVPENAFIRMQAQARQLQQNIFDVTENAAAQAVHVPAFMPFANKETRQDKALRMLSQILADLTEQQQRVLNDFKYKFRLAKNPHLQQRQAGEAMASGPHDMQQDEMHDTEQAEVDRVMKQTAKSVSDLKATGDEQREHAQARLNERKERAELDRVMEETKKSQAQLTTDGDEQKARMQAHLNERIASKGASKARKGKNGPIPRKTTNKMKGRSKQSSVSQEHKTKFVMDENTSATSRMQRKSGPTKNMREKKSH